MEHGGGCGVQGQRGFWEVEDRLKELSAEGDPLERLSKTVYFELFRPDLVDGLGRSDPSKGGRPGFDLVLKFKMLVLGATFAVRDWLSWMRFCGLGPGDTVADANTL
jgi:IS5 family transposase